MKWKISCKVPYIQPGVVLSSALKTLTIDWLIFLYYPITLSFIPSLKGHVSLWANGSKSIDLLVEADESVSKSMRLVELPTLPAEENL